MNYQDIARKMAVQYRLDPNLYARLVQAESAWNPNAVSPVGAMGLTQAMPATARDPGFGVAPLSDPFDPVESLRFGAEYFSAMLNRYNGDVPRALAAYNWGAGNADNWDGRMESLPEETRNYVSKITGGPMFFASSKGGQGLPPDELIVKRNLEGQIPPDELARLTERAILNSQEVPMGGPGFQSVDPIAASTMGGMDPALSLGTDPMQGAEGERDPWRFLEKLMPGMTMDQRNDRLLAIGAGLLSGSDWNEGFANAATNLLGVNQTEDERDFALQRDIMNATLDAQARQASAAQNVSYERIGSVMTPDGRIVGGVSYDPSTAEFFTMGPDGSRQSLPGAIPLNNSDASGSRFSTLAFKERDAAAEAAGTLRTVDRVLANLQNSPTGLAGGVNDLQRAFKTLVGMGLSPEEMARGLGQAEIQGLIGKFKDEVVGGGVMTEQDAARIVLSLGGDLQSIFTNPELMTERLNTLRSDAQRRYERHFNQYETYRQQFPYMPLNPLERYEGPGGVGTGGGDVEDILKELGI